MKSFSIFSLMLGLSFLIYSCDSGEDESEFVDVLVARPLTMTRAEFANSVDILAPTPIEESGKIYAYQDYIFVNDKYQGVHVIDNSNPESPQKVAFIQIPGNVDISIKGDYLYADSVSDLVVIDISNLQDLQIVNRLEGVLGENVAWPMAEVFEWGEIDYENEVLIGWETAVERRRVEDMPNPDILFEDAIAAAESGVATGQGGSLARFKIVGDYLYAVDSHNINIFDISNLDAPQDLEDVFAGFDIETIFNRGDHLFLGSMRGMYIYDISNPASPSFVSEFEHGTACDPVVVDDNYAYVTLRGGNFCGATQSGLYIIDIADITNPELVVIYPMDEPYGLGVKDNQLFVCDGSSGLKVYDKSNIPDLPQLHHFQQIVTYDVIPLDNSLLMIGDGILYQYNYTPDGISEISRLALN